MQKVKDSNSKHADNHVIDSLAGTFIEKFTSSSMQNPESSLLGQKRHVAIRNCLIRGTSIIVPVEDVLSSLIEFAAKRK